MKNLLKTFLILTLATSPAFALGTTANTLIENKSSDVTLNFQNETAANFTRVTSQTVTQAVQAIYGISGTFSGGQIAQTTGAGQEIGFTAHSITNISNTPVTINANNGLFTLTGINPGENSTWLSHFQNEISSLEQFSTSNVDLPHETGTGLHNHTSSIFNGRIYIIGGYNGAGYQDKIYIATLNADGTISNFTTSNVTVPHVGGTGLIGHTASVYNGFIYVTGGHNGSAAQNKIYIATLNADGTISNFTTSNVTVPHVGGTGLSNHTTSIFNGKIYIIGGNNGSTYEENIYAATLNADGTISAFITSNVTVPHEAGVGLGGHTSSIFNGRIYIVGGHNGSAYQDKVYIATLNANGTLSAFTTSPITVPHVSGTGLRYHTESVYNGRIYIIGGQNQNSSGHQDKIYVATLNANGTISAFSTSLITVPHTAGTGLSSHGASLYNGRIYISGGFTGSNRQDKIYISNLLSEQAKNIGNGSNQIYSFFTKPAYNAFNSSQGLVSVNYFLDYAIPDSQIGAYTGFNNNSYGGSGRVSALTTTTVSGPDLVFLSRSVQSIAPTSGMSYTGGSSSTVPGTKLKYTIVIKNQGTGASATTNIYQTVQNTANVVYYTASNGSEAATATYGTPVITFKNMADYVSANAYNLTRIKQIQWQFSAIPANQIVTLSYTTVVTQKDGNDEYTKLLLHGDDLTNNFKDYSSGKTEHHTLTAFGNVTQSVTQKMFGLKALAFDGTGDYITAPDSTDWDFGSADFTIDLWVNFSVESNGMFVEQMTTGDYAWQFYYEGTTDQLYFFSGGAAFVSRVGWTPITGRWYHLAAVRNGSSVDLYIDGVKQILITTNNPGTIPNSAGPLRIGSQFDNNYQFNGYMDEIRITKGIARWTSDFTPPERPYR